MHGDRLLSNTVLNCKVLAYALHLAGVGSWMDVATFSERIGADTLER
jgi:hypothetical protein